MFAFKSHRARDGAGCHEPELPRCARSNPNHPSSSGSTSQRSVGDQIIVYDRDDRVSCQLSMTLPQQSQMTSSVVANGVLVRRTL